jgi:hypothetical protein
MVTWCMKFYLCKTKNDIDLAIYKSIEWVDYYQSKELVYKTIQDIVNHAALNLFFLNSIKF